MSLGQVASSVVHLGCSFAVVFVLTAASDRLLGKTRSFPLLLWQLIGMGLACDNVRVALGIVLDPAVSCCLSYVCYFSHESLTPLGLLFLPLVYSRHSLVPVRRQFMLYVETIFRVVSIILSLTGLSRFVQMVRQDDWSIVENSLGVGLCRPTHHTSMEALFPIFVTVILLIALSAYLLFFQKGDNSFSKKKEADAIATTEDDRFTIAAAPATTTTAAAAAAAAAGSDNPEDLIARRKRNLYILFLGQLCVFIGNGFIGGNKMLMSLVGNSFEVLWLWSIGVAII